jgi:hypothetical protein
MVNEVSAADNKDAYNYAGQNKEQPVTEPPRSHFSNRGDGRGGNA